MGILAQESSYILTIQSKTGGTEGVFYADEIDYIDFTAGALVIHPKAGGEQPFYKTDLQWVAFSEDTRQAVDLGLSVKWAACNVGGNAPHDLGGLYSWGETMKKSDYSENRYKYYANGEYQYIGTNICGTRYDAAHLLWRGHWRLPTRAEVRELATLCTWTADVVEGVAGYRVTGPNGNSIFLPSAGYQDGKERKEVGTGGFYWTGTLNRDMPSSAYNINFRGYDAEWTACRAYGFSIRAVR
jgi:hypothetical protein